jgi:Mn-dependent DtxR family transcriptional regulator
MKDIIYEIYKDSKTVFRINDIALLLNVMDSFLYQKLNKLVKEGGSIGEVRTRAKR